MHSSTIKVHYVEHWHFTGWPEDGIPSEDEELIGCNKMTQALTEYLVNNYEEYRSDILIHCIDGRGVSGTFLTILC